MDYWFWYLLVSGLVALSFVSHQIRFPRRRLATRLEKQFPVLEQRLLTAIEIQEKGGELGYLESEVVREALEHSNQNDWSLVVSRRSMLFVRTFVFSFFVFALARFRIPTTRSVLSRSNRRSLWRLGQD